MRTRARVLMGMVSLVVLVATSGQRLGGVPPSKGIVLSPLGNYEASCFDQEVMADVDCYDEGAVEIAAYDPVTRRAFLTFASQPKIEIVDLSDPGDPALWLAIDLTAWGATAHATSVALHERTLAAAVPQGDEDNEAGKVLF